MLIPAADARGLGWRALLSGVLLAILCVVPRTITAQMAMTGPVMETEDEVPPDALAPPERLTGIGNVHLQVSAAPEAQTWFDQGLNLLHDFWDYESARAFEAAVRADPHCAMCYWGLYQAESFYHSTSPDYAQQALTTAVSLKDQGSDRDRLYIEASSARSDVLTRWRALVTKYPDDTEARIFLAQAVEDGFDAQGEPMPGQQEALAIFGGIMKEDPNNSAANHLYIHALEASAHPERALHSAEILAQLAPASGHLVHMPGHIFFRLGDYSRAETAFTASMAVDERYMRDQHVKPDNDWNYVHNLMYAVANLMEEGKLREANVLSLKLSGARGELASTLYTYSTRDSISRVDPRLPVALRTANWPEVRDLVKGPGPAGKPHLDFLASELLDFALGMQASAAGDVSAADAASARFAATFEATSHEPQAPPRMPNMMSGPPQQPRMPDALLQPLLSSLSVMTLELQGAVLACHHEIADAHRVFAEAEQAEHALGYREPPIYIRPVGEAEADALMAVADWADARNAYEQALLERPRSGFSLYGLALISEKTGHPDAAAKGYADFLLAWKDADADLPQVVHAKAVLARAN